MRPGHFLLAVLLGSTAALAGPYSRADLDALAKSETWAELVEHATDLPPSSRDAGWEALVVTAANQVLAATPAAEVLATLERLTTRFPFLKKAPLFRAVRDERGLEALKRCFSASTNVDCLEKVEAVAGGNSALLFKAAKVAMTQVNAYGPVTLFRKALEGAATPAQCEDDDLGRCVKAALELPHAEARAADARALLGGRCSQQLIDFVEADLHTAAPGSHFARNACPAFKKARALKSPNPCGG